MTGRQKRWALACIIAGIIFPSLFMDKGLISQDASIATRLAFENAGDINPAPS
jgi:hypothetical protein